MLLELGSINQHGAKKVQQGHKKLALYVVKVLSGIEYNIFPQK